jgi:hypothetical protein
MAILENSNPFSLSYKYVFWGDKQWIVTFFFKGICIELKHNTYESLQQ